MTPQNAERRRRLHQRLESVFEGAPCGIVVVDAEGLILDLNPAAEAIFGYRGPELYSQPVERLLPETARSAHAQTRRETVDAHRSMAGRFVSGLRKDGKEIVLQVGLGSLRDGDETFTAAFVLDMTAHRASETRAQTLLENASDAIAVVSAEGRIKECNRNMLSLLGAGREAVVGQPFSGFVTPTGSAQAEGLRSFLGAPGGSMRAENVEVKTRDGRTVQVDAALSVVDLGGEAVLLAVVRDVTERNKIQAQLAISDRMVSIGTLAAGVAHEINNPLAVVVSNIELAYREAQDHREALGAEASELLEELTAAREAARRVRDIIRDLKLFSRVSEEHLEALDVARVLESSVRMAFNEIKHRARLVKEIEGSPTVMGESARLGQVFLNLLVNAAQAIPEGHAEENEIRVRLFPRGTEVVIEIRDTGSGMAPEVKARLFTPFFTTKPVGVGTGLGLSICSRVVAALGGSIEVESEPGKGTLFRVILPGVDEPSLPEIAPLDAAAATRRGRILVVDDEESVGATLRRILGREHEVVVEVETRRALARLEAGERFDVILCDVMMPEMTGMDLFQALSARDPKVAATMIFVTGGAFTPKAQAFLRSVPNLRIDKPFEPQAVRALVNARIR